MSNRNSTRPFKTPHRDGCTRVFANYDPSCARCAELKSGAAPREGWGAAARKRERQLSAQIRSHVCGVSCGPVCTAFEW